MPKRTVAARVSENVTRSLDPLRTILTFDSAGAAAGAGAAGAGVGGTATGAGAAGAGVLTGTGAGLAVATGAAVVGAGVGDGVGVGVAIASAGTGPVIAPTAASAFRRPPVTDVPFRAGLTSTEDSSAHLSWALLAPGCAESARAAAPATCGVAIEVPLSTR